MRNWFYFDSGGIKQGLVTDEQLKELVEREIVRPDTILETESGHRGKAGQVQGLFRNRPDSLPVPVQSSQPVQTNGTEYLVSDYIGSFFKGLASVFGATRAKYILWQKMRLQIRKERAEIKKQEAEAYAIRKNADAELTNAKANARRALLEKESAEKEPTPLQKALALHGASKPNRKGEDGVWTMVFDGRRVKITTAIRKLAEEGIIVDAQDIWKHFK